MAETVYFRNQKIGDGLVTPAPGDRPLTPPVFRAGLFQDTAGVNSDSRNMLNTLVLKVHMQRDSVLAFVLAVRAVQQLAGQSGDLEIKDDGEVKILAENWFFQDAPAPPILPGFGGRFTDSWPLVFVGASEPVITL